jgi:hypothetical protein
LLYLKILSVGLEVAQRDPSRVTEYADCHAAGISLEYVAEQRPLRGDSAFESDLY